MIALLAVPLAMAALVVIAYLRDRGGPRRLEAPPEPAHPAEVAYLWSAFGGGGSPEPAFRAQLLHLAQQGIVEVQTVGTLSDPEDLIVRWRKPVTAGGPDAEFVNFLFPGGKVGDEMSLRSVAGDDTRGDILASWYMSLRLQTQASLTRYQGTGLMGLVRMARGWGDVFMGKKLRLGRKWSRAEALGVWALVIAAQIFGWYRQGLLALATYGAGAIALLAMPRQLPKPLRDRLHAWRAFRRYLHEFASLPEAPAAAVVVWERYLVYAVALDVADEVEDQVRELLPDRAVASMAGGGLLRFIGMGWIGQFMNPRTATMLAQAMQPMATQMQQIASQYLRRQP